MRHILALTLICSLFATTNSFPAASGSELTASGAHSQESVAADADKRPLAKKILFIGDSMTGWMADRLNAYGKANGFDVAAVVWDGSTIRKWGAHTDRIRSFIAKEKPDAIFVSLGLNELGERNPQTQLGPAMTKIKAAAGDIPVIWVGPPSWPGKSFGKGVDEWISSQMGKGHYYSSLALNLGRQSATNPHPSKQGITVWIDSLMKWMPDSAAIRLPGYAVPDGQALQRPKSFTYRRMKENL